MFKQEIERAERDAWVNGFVTGCVLGIVALVVVFVSLWLLL